MRVPGANRREKMTDVNIAVELLLDGFDEDGYEKALILSGDLDIWPAVFAITTRLPQPRVVEFWIPPDTPHRLLRDQCDWFGLSCSSVTPNMLYQSRFREEFEHEGQKITCHPKWRLSKEDKKRYAK